jgi:autoinducer 2-degrading protein
MYVTLVEIQVKPEYLQDFIAASRVNHEASVQEPGNLRFDILQSPQDPTRFVFYEAYATEADALCHKQTSHYAKWRDTVADWMAIPRRGINYDGLYPAAGQ